MTAPSSPEVQAIFAQLHALGVTPEQAAAGVAALTKGRFPVGARVRFARLEGPEVLHECAPPLGWEGVIDEDDNSPGLPFRVVGAEWGRIYGSGHDGAWWFAPEALDRLEDPR